MSIDFQYLAGKEYEHLRTCDMNLGCTSFVEPDGRVVDVSAVDDFVTEKKTNRCTQLRNATVNFISISKLKFMLHKKEYRDFFNLIYFGFGHLHYFGADVVEAIASKKCLLILENQIFVLSHRNKELQEFADSIREKLKAMKSAVEIPFDITKDYYINLILKCN